MKFIWRNISKLDDEQLIERFVTEQNQVALAELFKRYRHLVFGVCLKYVKSKEDAGDLTSQIYLKLQDKLAKHEVAHFKSWLYQLTKNECLMFLRKSKKVVHVELKTNVAQNNQELLEKRITELKINELLSAIEQLNADQQKCIRLFYLKKLSYKQIENQTDFSIKQIKSNIQNGKRNLKNQLLQHEAFSEERHIRTA